MSFSAIPPPWKKKQCSILGIGPFYFAEIGHYHFAVTVSNFIVILSKISNRSHFWENSTEYEASRGMEKKEAGPGGGGSPASEEGSGS